MSSTGLQPASVVSWRRLNAAIDGIDLPHRSKITMEPGGQIELSSLPAADICAAVSAMTADDAALRGALGEAGLALLATGTDPARGPVRINPGDRYAAMASYFAGAGYGAEAAAMMCSTASLQVNVEAGPESGWAERVAQHPPALSGADRAVGQQPAAARQAARDAFRAGSGVAATRSQPMFAVRGPR